MSEWIPFKGRDNRFKNHHSYLVSDGVEVTIGYWDCSEFVGTEKEIGKITHWMPLPLPPKESMYRKDFFKKMSIKEIRSIWQEDMHSFAVDGRMDLLTLWDYRILVEELLERLESTSKEKDNANPPYYVCLSCANLELKGSQGGHWGTCSNCKKQDILVLKRKE